MNGIVLNPGSPLRVGRVCLHCELRAGGPEERSDSEEGTTLGWLWLLPVSVVAVLSCVRMLL